MNTEYAVYTPLEGGFEKMVVMERLGSDPSDPPFVAMPQDTFIAIMNHPNILFAEQKQLPLYSEKYKKHKQKGINRRIW